MDMRQLRELERRTVAAHDEAARPQQDIPQHWRRFSGDLQQELSGPSWRAATGEPVQEASFLTSWLSSPRPGSLETFIDFQKAIGEAIAMPAP